MLITFQYFVVIASKMSFSLIPKTGQTFAQPNIYLFKNSKIEFQLKTIVYQYIIFWFNIILEKKIVKINLILPDFKIENYQYCGVNFLHHTLFVLLKEIK